MLQMIQVIMSFADLTDSEKTWGSITRATDLEDVMYNIGADLGDLIISLFGL